MTVPPQYQDFPDDVPDDEPVQTPGRRFTQPQGNGTGSGGGAAAPPYPFTPPNPNAPPDPGAPRPAGAAPSAPAPGTGSGRADARAGAPGPAGEGPEVGTEAEADDVLEGRIGILGPTGCGKTTFLGAVRIALEQRRAGLIMGTDPESNTFLAEAADRLQRQRVFFNATRRLSPNYSFKLRIERRNVRVATGWRVRKMTRTAEVSLDVLDAPGGMFRSQTPDAEPKMPGREQRVPYSTADRERLAEHLATSKGLILLLDPVREATEDDSYDYFQQIILEIATRSRFRRADPYLPHYLAICITKFDHPLVYKTVHQRGLYIEPRGEQEFPYAPPSTAREYFDLLCDEPRPNTNPGDDNSTSRLRNVIMQYFSPQRTSFFLTTAVGFRTDPRTRRFMATAPENVSYQRFGDQDGEWLLGMARPVNVLEPLMWLVQQQFKEKEKGR